ncbi:hypothetical protein KKH63_03100 [Patescibacteria group bacterium]|nr:hypothetical protein [Patescibacteria group bacterium]
MPKRKVLPDAEAFARFGNALLRRGFRKVSSVEFKKDFQRLGLKAPSPREGREVGFVFTANGLDVNVWTTFLEEEGRARESDSGWVLIKDADDTRYFAHPLRRTKNFLRNLLWHACIAKWRVEHRPLCSVCKNRMRIARGKGMKARFWKCVRPAFHIKAVSLPWDYGLPQEALDFLRPLRKRRARYYAKLRKQGKKPGAALRQRIGWKIGRPENIVLAR